jgi:hypothetical protein
MNQTSHLMKAPLRFSWKAIVLAPLLVPLVASSIMAMGTNQKPVFAFFFFFVLGSAFSYGVSVGLFLPGLFVLSRFTRLTVGRTLLFGTALGLMVYLPVAWVSYGASGDDSGPPSGTFGEYLWRQSGSEAWLFVVGGLVTALFYWFLSRPLRKLEAFTP